MKTTTTTSENYAAFKARIKDVSVTIDAFLESLAVPTLDFKRGQNSQHNLVNLDDAQKAEIIADLTDIKYEKLLGTELERTKNSISSGQAIYVGSLIDFNKMPYDIQLKVSYLEQVANCNNERTQYNKVPEGYQPDDICLKDCKTISKILATYAIMVGNEDLSQELPEFD